MIHLANLFQILISVIWWIIIGQAILSWLVAFNVINTQSDFVRQLLYALDRMTEPVYRPIRRIMPDFGALDLTPMVVLILLAILDGVLLPAFFEQFGVLYR